MRQQGRRFPMPPEARSVHRHPDEPSLRERICPECLCVGKYGICHCDNDIYGPNCYKRGRHEEIENGN